MRDAGCEVRGAGCGVAGCVWGYGVRGACCEMRVTGCGMRVARCGLRGAGCVLRGARFGISKSGFASNFLLFLNSSTFPLQVLVFFPTLPRLSSSKTAFPLPKSNYLLTFPPSHLLSSALCAVPSASFRCGPELIQFRRRLPVIPYSGGFPLLA